MPQHPSDQAPQESSGHTAHKVEDKVKASVHDLQTKGPQLTDNLPPAASKEELQAKARELNK